MVDFVLDTLRLLISNIPPSIRPLIFLFGLFAPIWIIVLYRKLYFADWTSRINRQEAVRYEDDMKCMKERFDSEYAKMADYISDLDARDEAFSELSTMLSDSLNLIAGFEDYSNELVEQLEQLGADPRGKPPSPYDYGSFGDIADEVTGEHMMQVWEDALKKSRREADEFRSLPKEERLAHYMKNWLKTPSSND